MHMSYGVNEVLLASVLGAVVFAFLAGQPLVIVGVTGLCIFRATIDSILCLTMNYRPYHSLQLHGL